MCKILLVGCGYWGKNWYNTIKNSQYELVAVVDPNPVLNPKEDGIPLFNQLSDINVEFTHAIIATPVQYHFDTFIFLVDGDIAGPCIKPENILVEKPCGLNSEQASIMQDVYPGFIFLHDPIYQYIKDNIDKLGDILSFNSVRASMGPRIRTDVTIIEDYLIHDLYIFADLFGTSDIHVRDVLKIWHFNHPIKYGDIDLSLSKRIIRAYNGSYKLKAKMFSSWWWPLKERKIVIVGTKGSFVWENDKLDTIKDYYEEISGQDAFGNINYKLVKNAPCHNYRNCMVEKSNLELELDSFMFGKKPFSDTLLLDIWKFIDTTRHFQSGRN